MSNHDDGTNDRFHLYSAALVDRLKMMSGKQEQGATQFADDVCRSVLGTALDPKAYASLDEDEQFDFVAILEGVLNSADIVAMVFLVRKMTLVSSKNYWDALSFVDQLCRAVIDASPSPYVRTMFEHDGRKGCLCGQIASSDQLDVQRMMFCQLI